MARTGTNNGGGPRWADMPRATCPKCGLNRPVGVTQHEDGFYCRSQARCEARAKRKKAKK